MVEPHRCLRVEDILGRFGRRKGEAQQRYRAFIEDGIEKPSIWEGLKGQSLLGGEAFVEEMAGYTRGKAEIKEIPRGQRYLGRPSLQKLFQAARRRKAQRDKLIAEAVERHGYSQKDLAGFLGLHYSTISRLVKEVDGHQK